MAGTITLKKAFATGQGAGITNYFTYANDHDSNYTTIESAINQLTQELLGVQGPNASLFTEILGLTDSAGPRGVEPDGVIGQHSYQVSIGSPTTTLDVTKGSAIVSGSKVTLASDTNISGPGGGATDHYVALDENGTPSIETAAGGQILDVARVAWNGSAYTGSVYQQAEIFIDGDDYAEMRRRPEIGDGTTPTFPALDHSGGPPITVNAFRYVADRILDIENIIAGIKTGQQDGTTMGAIGIAGTVSAPGMITTDGSTFDTGTGLYRAGADVLGITVEQALCVRFDLRGSTRQVLVENAGTLANPVIARASDENTGINFPGSDQLDLVTNSTIRATLDANGNLDLPTNARVQGNRTTARTGCTSGNQHTLEFNAADSFDIGNGTDNWHDHTSNPGDEEFTVPTGCDGLYHLVFEFELETATSTICDVEMYIMKNGTTIGTHEIATYKESTWSGATEDLAAMVHTYDDLVATDVIRVVYKPTTATSVDYDVDWCKLSIIKVA